MPFPLFCNASDKMLDRTLGMRFDIWPLKHITLRSEPAYPTLQHDYCDKCFC